MRPAAAYAREEAEALGESGGILVVSPSPGDRACLRGIFETRQWKVHPALRLQRPPGDSNAWGEIGVRRAVRGPGNPRRSRPV